MSNNKLITDGSILGGPYLCCNNKDLSLMYCLQLSGDREVSRNNWLRLLIYNIPKRYSTKKDVPTMQKQLTKIWTLWSPMSIVSCI